MKKLKFKDALKVQAEYLEHQKTLHSIKLAQTKLEKERKKVEIDFKNHMQIALRLK